MLIRNVVVAVRHPAFGFQDFRRWERHPDLTGRLADLALQAALDVEDVGVNGHAAALPWVGQHVHPLAGRAPRGDAPMRCNDVCDLESHDVNTCRTSVDSGRAGVKPPSPR